MQESVIIVAGGRGTRMGGDLPKQFLEINGKPILVHTIKAFYAYNSDINIILVLPESHFSVWEEISARFDFGKRVTVAPGGNTRFQSVKSGLKHVSEGTVAIHDAVRPFISVEIISNCFRKAASEGSAVAMVPVKDSIRMKLDGGKTKLLDRTNYYIVQTPQVFQVSPLLEAYEQEEKEYFTDDASVYEAAGNAVGMVLGSYENIKITTPEDLKLAEISL